MRSFTELIDRSILAIAPRAGAKRIAAPRSLPNSKSCRSGARTWPRMTGPTTTIALGRTAGSRAGFRPTAPSRRICPACGVVRSSFIAATPSRPASSTAAPTTSSAGACAPARIKADDDEESSQEEARKLNAALDSDFRRWRGRAGRRGESLTVLQRLAQRTWDLCGEVFIHFCDVADPQKPIPLAIEIIDPERVETPPEQANNPNVRMGIERDPETHAIVAYYGAAPTPATRSKRTGSSSGSTRFTKTACPSSCTCSNSFTRARRGACRA